MVRIGTMTFILLLEIGKFFYFMHVIVIHGHVLSEETNGNNTLPDYPAELTLLRYNVELCGGVHWCSVRTRYARADTCCGTCGCDGHCAVRGDCCPDYDFLKDIKITFTDNIESFVAAYTKWSALSTQNRISSITIPPSARQGCVRSQLLTPSRYIEMTPSYIMTTKCISTMTIGNRGKCEYSSLDEISSPTFEDVIPVQSVENRTIYRNKHCAECNIGAAPVIAWSVIVRCANEQIPIFYFSHFNSPLAILNNLLSPGNVKPNCDITFEPQNKVMLKLYSCVNSNAFDCIEPDNLSHICNRFSSPVYIFNESNRLMTFKNAACLKCKNGSSFSTDSCRLPPNTRRLQMTLNIHPSLDKIGVKESVNTSLYKLFPSANGCKPGETLDTSSGKCWKLYCPRFMYAANGNCQFMFTHVSSGAFVAYWSVKPNTTAVGDDFERSLYQIILSLSRSYSRVKVEDLSIWSSKDSEYVIYVAITGNDSKFEYSDVISYYRDFLWNPLVLNMEKFVIKCELSLTSSVTRVFRAVMDKSTHTEYTLAYPLGWRPKIILIRFEIRESNFCYRVQILPEDFNYLGNTVSLQYKVNQLVLWDYSEDITTGSQGKNRTVLVCQHHFIDNPSIRNANESTTEEDWLASVGYSILIVPLLVCAVVITLGVIYGLRSKRTSSIPSPPSHSLSIAQRF